MNKRYKIDEDLIYKILDKIIFSWSDFACSLFPNMRYMTKEEQKIWNEMDNEISEIIEI